MKTLLVVHFCFAALAPYCQTQFEQHSTEAQCAKAAADLTKMSQTQKAKAEYAAFKAYCSLPKAKLLEGVSNSKPEDI